MNSDTQETPKKVFQGIKECSAATGVPLDLILRARSHPDAPRGSDGFHQSGRIAWHIIGPWIEAHKEELESVSEETLEHWQLRKVRAAALNEELELEENYKRVVDKATVIALLERIGAAQVSLFNSKIRQELPARLNLAPEQIQEIDKVLTELFSVMQKGVEDWK